MSAFLGLVGSPLQCADVEHARARAPPNAGACLCCKNKAELSTRKV